MRELDEGRERFAIYEDLPELNCNNSFRLFPASSQSFMIDGTDFVVALDQLETIMKEEERSDRR